MQNVVVTFQAKQQETESLALALGLGAVQRGANIRRRHLDPSPDFKMAHAGYGTLKPDVLRWAEGVEVVFENEIPEDLSPLEVNLLAVSADPGSVNRWFFV